MKKYIGPDAENLHDARFEGAVFKVLQKKERELSIFEKNAARSLQFSRALGTGDVANGIDSEKVS